MEWSTEETTTELLPGKLVSPVVNQANEGAFSTDNRKNIIEHHGHEKVTLSMVDRNFLKVNLNCKDTFALVDSGSDLTLVGQSFLSKHPDVVDQIRPCTRFAQTANAASFKITGTLFLNLKIAGVTYQTLAYVSPTTPWEMILGVDFMNQFGVQIDFENNLFKIPKYTNLFSVHKIVLPPMAEKMVKCSLSRRAKVNLTGTICGKSFLQRKGISCIEAYVEIQAGHKFVPVRFRNDSSEAQVLYPGTKVAYLEIPDSSELLEDVSTNQKSKHSNNFVNNVKAQYLFDNESFDNTLLSENEKEQLKSLLKEYDDIFQKPNEPLGVTNILKHKIKLVDNAKPFRSCPYRMNPHHRSEVSKQLQEMLDQGICRESESPFASPVILVRKADGTLRFVVDMRKLNDITVKDCYPLMRIDDALDNLGGAKYFATLDLQSGYWQVELDEESKPLTAFVTDQGLFEFNRMCFGLCNAPSTFSRVMARAMKGLLWSEVLIYLDDLIIFARTFDEYLSRIRNVFERLRSANLKLKPQKCKFGQQKVTFLGHVVTPNGVTTDPRKCDAIQHVPVPHRLKELRSFLGLTNYYARFVPRYREIARPLYRLTRKNTPFLWTSDCQRAFEHLKQLLQSTQVLAYPQFDKPFILETDASGFAIGFVLSQEHDGQLRPIHYAGRNLTEAEKKYSTTEREALAVYQGVNYFRSYLEDREFEIRTDHLPLTYVFKRGYGNSRIQKWALYLSKYRFDIRYKQGAQLHGPDTLSRIEYPAEQGYFISDLPNLDDSLFPPTQEAPHMKNQDVRAARLLKPPRKKKDPLDLHFKARERIVGERLKNQYLCRGKPLNELPKHITVQQLSKWQRKEHWMTSIIKYLEDKDLPGDARIARAIVAEAPDYFLEEDVLYRLYVPPHSNENDPRIRLQLCVPEPLKFDILQAHHGDLPAAHYDPARTYATIRLNFFWKGMQAECKKWVNSCDQCQRRNQSTKPYKAPLQPLPIARINDRWAFDIVGPLVRSKQGNEYILCFTEYATRYVEAFALPVVNAATIARVLVDEICLRYGPPAYLLSDKGANLLAEVVSVACKLIGTKRITTSPYHPACDGLVEKFNGVLVKNLRAFVDRNGKDWCEFIRPLVYSYNTSVCIKSTHYTPFYLMFGREPRTFISMSLPVVNEGHTPDIRAQIAEVVQRLHFAHEDARKNLEKHREAMKTYYDKDCKIHEYAVGDRVWVFFPHIQSKGPRKFYNAYSGPYTIIEKIGPVNFKLLRTHDLQPLRNIIHVNRMKPYVHRQIVPPDPEDLEDIDMGIPTDETELHPLDQEAFRGQEEVKDSFQNENVLIDVEKLNKEDSQSSIIDQLPVNDSYSDALSRKDNSMVMDINHEPEVIINPNDEVISPLSTNLRRSKRIRKNKIDNDFIVGEELDGHSLSNEPEHELEKIIRGKWIDDELQYLVKWKGFSMKDASFVKYKDLNDAARRYLKEHRVPITGRRSDKQ